MIRNISMRGFFVAGGGNFGRFLKLSTYHQHVNKLAFPLNANSRQFASEGYDRQEGLSCLKFHSRSWSSYSHYAILVGVLGNFGMREPVAAGEDANEEDFKQSLADLFGTSDTENDPQVGIAAIVRDGVDRQLGQPKPSIHHKLAILDEWRSRQPQGDAPDLTYKIWFQHLKKTHVKCCGALDKKRLEGWQDTRISQRWDELPESMRCGWRVPNDWRETLGLKKLGGSGALETQDEIIRDLLDRVKLAITSERKKGNSVTFTDIQTTFREEVGKEKLERLEHNDKIAQSIKQVQEAQLEEDRKIEQVSKLEAQLLKPLRLNCSVGWIVQKLEDLACEKKTVKQRSEARMVPFGDADFQMHLGETYHLRETIPCHPMLQSNYDEMPFQGGQLPKAIYTTAEAEATRQNRLSDSAYCQKHSTFKEHITFGTMTFPLGKGKLFMQAKDNSSGGQRAVDKLNREFPRELFAMREGTGFCNKELWNKHVLPRIVFPSYGRYRSDLKLWRHEHGNTGMFHYDGATAHAQTQASAEKIAQEDLFFRPLYPNSSGHSQVQDALHAIIKARAYKLLKPDYGMSANLFNRSTEEHLTPGGALRGPDTYQKAKRVLEAFRSLTIKEIISAWLVTRNLTVAEAAEGLQLKGLTPEECTKEGIYNLVQSLVTLEEIDQDTSSSSQNLKASLRREANYLVPNSIALAPEQMQYRKQILRDATFETVCAIIMGKHKDLHFRQIGGAPVLEYNAIMPVLWALQHARPSQRQVKDTGIGIFLAKQLRTNVPEVPAKMCIDVIIKNWQNYWECQRIIKESPETTQTISSSSASSCQASASTDTKRESSSDPTGPEKKARLG